MASALQAQTSPLLKQTGEVVEDELLIKVKSPNKFSSLSNQQESQSFQTLSSLQQIGGAKKVRGSKNIFNLKLGQEFSKIKKLKKYSLVEIKNKCQQVKNQLASLGLEIQTCGANHRYKVFASPNDEFYSVQTSLAQINAPTVWDSITSAASVPVAIVDTGVDYNHVDLNANMWVNLGETAANSIDDDSNGYVDDIHGYDFVNNDGAPLDDQGHGTHVAGIVGAVGNNAIGVVGVAWTAKIMALKFLDQNGSGTTEDAVSSIQYAIDNGARVINNSWGGADDDTILENVYQDAADAEVALVAAAGNDGDNNNRVASYPADYSDGILSLSVAATDSNDLLASFSNYGSNTVHIAAPGVEIASTLPSNTYGYESGTSMSSPHVAGALALLAALHPGESMQQIVARVMNNVQVVSNLASQVTSGGRLDLLAAATNSPAEPILHQARIRKVVSATLTSGKIVSKFGISFSSNSSIGTKKASLAVTSGGRTTTCFVGNFTSNDLQIVTGSVRKSFIASSNGSTVRRKIKAAIRFRVKDVDGNKIVYSLPTNVRTGANPSSIPDSAKLASFCRAAANSIKNSL